MLEQRPRKRVSAWLPVLLGATCVCIACDERKGLAGRDAGLTEPSPNASILPAPLASGPDSPLGGKKTASDEPDHREVALDAGADAGPTEPRSLREDQALPAETPHETSGLSLAAHLRWLDLSPAPRVPEQNAEGLQRAREAVGFDVVVDLAGGRMRLAFVSRAFTLPAGSELRARDDLYGQALVWPNHGAYTLVTPGALRSLLSQQRADVVPLVRARSNPLGSGTLFSLRTERTELSTPTGKLELEQARGSIPPPPNAAWASGTSLCRLLLELVGASPVSTTCRAELVPVRAVYTWPNGEHFAFEVSRLQRRFDLNPGALAVPPASAEFRQGERPPPPASALLSDIELSEFRLRPTPRTERAEPNAPKIGLLLVNHGESLRYFSVDGAPAARLAPGTEQLLLGLRPGRYQVTARDFFGNEDALTKVVELPARVGIGEESEKNR